MGKLSRPRTEKAFGIVLPFLRDSVSPWLDSSPAALLHHVGFRHGGYGQPLHRTGAFFAGFEKHFGVVEVCGSAHDRAGSALGLFWRGEVDGIAHEDSRSNEYSFGAKLADERGIGGRSDTAGGEIRDWKLTRLGNGADKFVRCAQLLSSRVEFFLAEHS